MATVNEKMTAIADPIRTLMGVTGALGLDAMASNLNGANTEVADQTALIAQIMSVLDDKAIESGVDVEVGTFIPTEDTSNHTFTFSKTHDSPVDLMVCMKFGTGDVSISTVGFIYNRIGNGTYDVRLYSRYYSDNLFPRIAETNKEIIDTNQKITHNWMLLTGESSRVFFADTTYLWIAIWGATV